jgi:7-carboxy-7-deazaguanine synthase
MSLGRIEDYNKILRVLELYTAVQSEGSRAGYPTIVVRTTGCTHRCYFGEGGWCDSWYTSIHPEKGKYTFQSIIDMYNSHPHIKEMMLTGGSPTMHKKLVNELTHFANERDIFITIETEGSHFLPTDYPIDLLSISPKFSNSIPTIGAVTPTGKIADERMIKQHNKFRVNKAAIKQSIEYHNDYHIKPVLDKDLTILNEIEDFIDELEVPNEKIWAMPAGDTREELVKSYPIVMNFVRDKGWRFTGRSHIMAFDTEREV